MKKYKSIIVFIPELKGHIISSKNQALDTFGSTITKRMSLTLFKLYQKI